MPAVEVAKPGRLLVLATALTGAGEARGAGCRRGRVWALLLFAVALTGAEGGRGRPGWGLLPGVSG